MADPPSPPPSPCQSSRPSASTDTHAPSLVEVESKVIRWWHPLVIVLGLVGLFILFDRAGIGSELRHGDLAGLRQWMESFGVLGPVAFLAIYTFATLVGFPTSPLTFAAGALLGPLVGIIAATVASTISATLSFLIARHFARDPVQRWLADKPRFQQIDRMTHRHGVLVVLVLRLVHVLPFSVVNYGLGLTRLSFSTYVLWSFIGRLPGTLMLVLLGDAIYRVIRTGDVPWPLVTLVLAMLAALALVIRALNRRLSQREAEVVDQPGADHLLHPEHAHEQHEQHEQQQQARDRDARAERHPLTDR